VRTSAVSERPPLLTWDALNDTLLRMRVIGDRLKMFRNGAPCAEERYLSGIGSPRGALVKAAAVVQLLKSGATLVLNHAHELFDTVGVITDSLANTFRVSVGANVYIGFGAERGFDLHWDTHDTLIVQVSGRKHWKVFAPTQSHPLERPDSAVMLPRTAEPVLDDILDTGDTLYLPRGWWHVATPINEQSLHITFSIKHPTGVDLIRQLAEIMAGYEEARQDLPLHGTTELRTAYVERLTTLLAELCSGDPIEAYYQMLDQHRDVRSTLGLPTSVTAKAALTHATPLVLAESSRLELRPMGDGRLCFIACGRLWACDNTYRSPLMRLTGGRGTSIADLTAMVAPQERRGLAAVVSAMFLEGVITVQPQ